MSVQQPTTLAVVSDPKAGWKTTEFWGKVIVQLIGLLVLTGVIRPVDTSSPVVALEIQIGAGVLAMVVPEVAYALSRGFAKLGGR